MKDDYTQKVTTLKALRARVKSLGWGGVKVLKAKCPKHDCSCSQLRLLPGPSCCADLFGYYPSPSIRRN